MSSPAAVLVLLWRGTSFPEVGLSSRPAGGGWHWAPPLASGGRGRHPEAVAGREWARAEDLSAISPRATAEGPETGLPAGRGRQRQPQRGDCLSRGERACQTGAATDRCSANVCLWPWVERGGKGQRRILLKAPQTMLCFSCCIFILPGIVSSFCPQQWSSDGGSFSGDRECVSLRVQRMVRPARASLFPEPGH